MSKGINDKISCACIVQWLDNKFGFVILSSITSQRRFCNCTGVCLVAVVARLSGIVDRLCGYNIVHYLRLDFVLYNLAQSNGWPH